MSEPTRPSCASCARRVGARCDEPALRDLDLSDYLTLGARPAECPGYRPTERARRRLALIDLGRAIDRLGDGPEREALRSTNRAIRERLDAEDATVASELPDRLAARLRGHARRLLDRANCGDPDTLAGRDEADRDLARYLSQWAREVEAGTWARWRSESAPAIRPDLVPGARVELRGCRSGQVVQTRILCRTPGRFGCDEIEFANTYRHHELRPDGRLNGWAENEAIEVTVIPDEI